MDDKPEDIGPRDSNLINRITDLLEHFEQKLKEHAANKLLYTRDEAAALLSISVESLDLIILHGDIRVRHVGRRRLVHRDELERFAKSKAITAIWPEKGPDGTRRRIA